MHKHVLPQFATKSIRNSGLFEKVVRKLPQRLSAGHYKCGDEAVCEVKPTVRAVVNSVDKNAADTLADKSPKRMLTKH